MLTWKLLTGAGLEAPDKNMAKIIGNLYQNFLKPFLFRFDAEKVHDAFVSLGALLGGCYVTRFLVRSIFRYDHPSLETEVHGLKFKNPIGLAAGFDKNGRMLSIMPAVGFGFMEVGSVTGRPCAGNLKPRIWRLPEQQSLVVNYGLANEGVDIIAKRLARKSKSDFLTGTSVAMTNCWDNLKESSAIEDYVKAFTRLEPVADFLTINISCPNAQGGKMFLEPGPLENLLVALDALPTSKTILLKLSPNLEIEKLDQLLDVIGEHRVHGLICSNLTKEGEGQKGGLSGRAVFDKSNRLIAHCYKKVGNKMFIVGCGGVMSADDAYTKIKLGASLIQLVTGMIYEGPQLIGEINRGLVERLKADGLQSIKEAVGIDILIEDPTPLDNAYKILEDFWSAPLAAFRRFLKEWGF